MYIFHVAILPGIKKKALQNRAKAYFGLTQLEISIALTRFGEGGIKKGKKPGKNDSVEVFRIRGEIARGGVWPIFNLFIEFCTGLNKWQ